MLDWKRHDPVYLDMEFGDVEQFGISPPMPRWIAEAAMYDFSQGVPWLNGERVTKAVIVPWMPWE